MKSSKERIIKDIAGTGNTYNLLPPRSLGWFLPAFFFFEAVGGTPPLFVDGGGGGGGGTSPCKADVCEFNGWGTQLWVT